MGRQKIAKETTAQDALLCSVLVIINVPSVSIGICSAGWRHTKSFLIRPRSTVKFKVVW